MQSKRHAGGHRRWWYTCRAWLRFWREHWRYCEHLQLLDSNEPITIYPCLDDWTSETPIEPIYYYQDWWAFKKICEVNPELHVDVGSHHKFVALLSCVVRVTFVDIRPPSLPLEGLNFVEGSLLKLPFEDHSLQSVSSLCVVEHIGLGRYGDSLDARGSEKSLTELKRVLRPGGMLYLSVPIEKNNHTYFNAHRSFEEQYLLELCSPLLLKEKTYIHGSKLVKENPGEWCVGCYALQCP
jgi:SAM-dependent methyltransferase